jgi:uncharacterized protein (DUF362 family)
MKRDDKKKPKALSRKEFLRRGGKFALGAAIAPWILNAACSNDKAEASAEGAEPTAESNPEPKLWIAKDAGAVALTRKAVEAAGGMSKYVSEGDNVALIPNIAWARAPEYAANTHPDVVKTLTEMCFEAGANQVEVFCHPCNTPKVTYEISGISEAANDAGAYLHFLTESDFEEVDVPDAIWSKKAKVAKALLNADVFINAPVAKHHGLSKLTLIQKNLMGIVYNRGVMHKNIHPELVALQKAFPADLYIIDCTRILLRNGPSGGNLNDVKEVKQVVAGVDPIAMEAYVATLFEKDPASIGYIKQGAEAGLGTMDWASCAEIVA